MLDDLLTATRSALPAILTVVAMVMLFFVIRWRAKVREEVELEKKEVVRSREQDERRLQVLRDFVQENRRAQEQMRSAQEQMQASIRAHEQIQVSSRATVQATPRSEDARPAASYRFAQAMESLRIMPGDEAVRDVPGRWIIFRDAGRGGQLSMSPSEFDRLIEEGVVEPVTQRSAARPDIIVKEKATPKAMYAPAWYEHLMGDDEDGSV